MKIIHELGSYDFSLTEGEHLHLVIFLKRLSGTFSANIHLAEGARLQLEQIILGGNVDSSLILILDKDAELKQNVALQLSRDNKLHYNYFANHLGEHSSGTLKISGSLNDSASKSSELKIHFAKGATGAIGSEEEKINLFSDSAKNITIPTIYSDESEAQGKHSFGSSHFSEDELSYLQARGIDSDKIKTILAQNDLLRVAKLTKQDYIIKEVYEY